VGKFIWVTARRSPAAPHAERISPSNHQQLQQNHRRYKRAEGAVGFRVDAPVTRRTPPTWDRNTERFTLGVGLAVSAFPLSVPV